MVRKTERPGMKVANVKVTDADMVYFSLGLGTAEYILPTERDDYRSDARAVELVADIQAGKNLSGRDFSGINLKNADLSGGCFSGCNFSGAVFYKTNASGADFSEANFTEAYLEGVDFSKANLTHACFKRVYARALILDEAQIDDAECRRFEALELLIEKIESGEIDIRFLSKADLLGLDLRRLDLTHVDLEGVDLSSFVLEGVNLRGVYIDPKQLMSLDGLMHYYAEVRAMNAKRLQMETLRVMKENADKNQAYARMKSQERQIDKVIYSNAVELKRPKLKPVLLPESEVQTPKRPPVTLKQAIEVEYTENKKRQVQKKLTELKERLAVQTTQGAEVLNEKHSDDFEKVSQNNNLKAKNEPVSPLKEQIVEKQMPKPLSDMINETDQNTLLMQEDKTKNGVLVNVDETEKVFKSFSLDEVKAGFSLDPVIHDQTDYQNDEASLSVQKKDPSETDEAESEEEDVLEIKCRPALKTEKEVIKHATSHTEISHNNIVDSVSLSNVQETQIGIHQMAQKPRKITSQAYENADDTEKELSVEGANHKTTHLVTEIGRDVHKKKRT